MKKIRYIEKDDNPNIGLDDIEITILQEKLGIILNQVVTEFLQKAGKKSNVLNANFQNVEELIEINETLRIKLLANNNLTQTQLRSILFVDKYYDALGNEIFLYSNLNELNSPIYSFSDGEVPIGVNFRDERTEKIGIHKTNYSFTEFINNKTNDKFGITLSAKIIGLIPLIIFLPFWLPFWIYGLYASRK